MRIIIPKWYKTRRYKQSFEFFLKVCSWLVDWNVDNNTELAQKPENNKQSFEFDFQFILKLILLTEMGIIIQGWHKNSKMIKKIS